MSTSSAAKSVNTWNAFLADCFGDLYSDVPVSSLLYIERSYICSFCLSDAAYVQIAVQSKPIVLSKQ
jgi:hypothetical protein